jgi:ribosome modulation factor
MTAAAVRLVSQGVPGSFFARPRREWRRAIRPARVKAGNSMEVAEAQGLQDGQANRHTIPWLKFQTGAEWCAWLRGWRKGQVEICS